MKWVKSVRVKSQRAEICEHAGIIFKQNLWRNFRFTANWGIYLLQIKILSRRISTKFVSRFTYSEFFPCFVSLYLNLYQRKHLMTRKMLEQLENALDNSFFFRTENFLLCFSAPLPLHVSSREQYCVTSSAALSGSPCLEHTQYTQKRSGIINLRCHR